MGYCELSSGATKSCQIVGWDTCTLDNWRQFAPNTVPSAFDLNTDAAYVTPQLSGGSFDYMRLPHVSHGVFEAGPIGGTYALPQTMSDKLVLQLRTQHLSQSRLYGAAPSAVAFAPPSARSWTLTCAWYLAGSRSATCTCPGTCFPPRYLNLSVFLIQLFFHRFRTFLAHPDGAAASDRLAQRRAARIQVERRPRPLLSEAEKAAARHQRALGREIDDFMSTASVFTAEEIHVRQV